MQAADSSRSIRAASILRAHGYRQGASHQVKGSRLDFYSGPRGCVIVQVWPKGNGVTMYADWPLGLTWEQTELALVRGALEPEARKFAPVVDDRNPVAALLSTLSTWREAGGDAIHLSTLAQDWPDETATLEDLIILATEAQKDGWQFAPLQTESNALIEKIASLADTDARRDYYAREMVSNIRNPMGGRIEDTDELRLIVAPGFEGARNSKVEGETWEEIMGRALESLRRELHCETL